MTIHDTLRDTINKDKIVLKNRIDTVRVKDSIKVDTNSCYSFDKTYPDRTYIKATLCSSEFPKTKPNDLIGEIFYKAKPDSIIKIKLVDTLIKTSNIPFYKQPIWWVGLVLGGVGGYFVGHR